MYNGSMKFIAMPLLINKLGALLEFLSVTLYLIPNTKVKNTFLNGIAIHIRLQTQTPKDDNGRII